MFSGRPMIVDDVIKSSNAFVAAWLPGTTGGEAVASTLSGEYRFRYKGKVNTLPVAWVSSMDSLKDYPIYTTN